MATIRNTANGGTNATAATTANTGGTSGTAFATVSIAGSSAINFSNEQASEGSLSYKFVTNGTDAQYVEWLPTAAASAAFRAYVYMPTLPTAGNGFIRILTAGGGTTLAHILVRNGGDYQIQDSAGTVVFTASPNIPAATWLRVEGSITNGVSTTGTMKVDWYVGDSLTPISGLSANLTAQNFGTANIGRIRFGRTAAFGTWANFYIDALAFADGTTTYIGPQVNAAPTLSLTANQNVSAGVTVNATATASDSDGTISSYLWTVDYSSTTAPTLSGSTTANVSFTSPAAGNLVVLKCVVTDNGGATATSTTEVRIPTSSSPITVLPDDSGKGYTTGGAVFTVFGGAANPSAALSDSNNATGIESAAVTVTSQYTSHRLVPMGNRASFEITVLQLRKTDSGSATAQLNLKQGNSLRESYPLTLTTTATDVVVAVEESVIATFTDMNNIWIELQVDD